MAPSREVRVSDYSIKTLEQLLSSVSGAPPASIQDKLHLDYFKEYLGVLNAKTIVVEKEYIDRDFLEDFAGYYVRCFHPYERKCCRLHFFSHNFAQVDFHNLLAGIKSRISESTLIESYLGFIVVKPLPQTVIGRTCLRPYSEDAGRRHFTTLRTYKANLFGIDLSVDSLAFQEQDTVTAACATSALWSVFHGTGELFHHSIPSPVDITKAATENFPIVSRVLPNKDGLNGAQMARAIRSVNLEPLHAGFDDEYILKGKLYAYLKMKIPAILGMKLKDLGDSPVQDVGKHAVAVAGFSLGHSTPVKDSYGFTLKSYRIDKLYVHDDQLGPFARMKFAGDATPKLTTSWKVRGGKGGTIFAFPDLLLIPLYHKIRIPFEVIHKVVANFDLFIEQTLRRHGKLPKYLEQPFEWDIYLSTVNDLKNDIFCMDKVHGDLKTDVLLEGMPRYIWRATATIDSNYVLDLIFDATDIEQGTFFYRAIEYDSVLSSALRAGSKNEGLDLEYQTKLEWKIIEWFRNQPLPKAR